MQIVPQASLPYLCKHYVCVAYYFSTTQSLSFERGLHRKVTIEIGCPAPTKTSHCRDVQRELTPHNDIIADVWTASATLCNSVSHVKCLNGNSQEMAACFKSMHGTPRVLTILTVVTQDKSEAPGAHFGGSLTTKRVILTMTLYQPSRGRRYFVDKSLASCHREMNWWGKDVRWRQLPMLCRRRQTASPFAPASNGNRLSESTGTARRPGNAENKHSHTDVMTLPDNHNGRLLCTPTQVERAMMSPRAL